MDKNKKHFEKRAKSRQTNIVFQNKGLLIDINIRDMEVGEIDLQGYISKNFELISKSKIEEILKKYLKNYLAGGGFNNGGLSNIQ